MAFQQFSSTTTVARPTTRRPQPRWFTSLLWALGLTFAAGALYALLSTGSNNYTQQPWVRIHRSAATGNVTNTWSGLRSASPGRPSQTALVQDSSADSSTVSSWVYSDVELEQHCGSWMKEYASLHEEILSGSAPPRYAVTGCFSGLADDLVGGVTVFYYALLSGRAFQWTFANAETAFEWGYAPRSINWTISRPYRRLAWNSEYEEWETHDPPFDDSATTIYYGESMQSSNEELEPGATFVRGDVVNFAADYEHVYIRNNFGFTVRLFENEHVEGRLKALGLRKETAFACAMNYLVEPLPEVQRMFSPEFAVLSDPAPLKIGIQLRRGDLILANADADDSGLKEWHAWFDCAQQIEDSQRQPGQEVVWFLVCDSMHIREAAVAEYGSKLVTKTQGFTLKHIAPQSEGGGGGEEAFQSAVGEHWLFGLTDVQVISGHSGYGKTGAFRSFKPMRIYTIEQHQHRNCGPDDEDSVDDLARESQGI